MNKLLMFFITVAILLSVLTIPATALLNGDINVNDKIDARDYVLLKRAYFETYKLTQTQQALADINGNGKIDARDYLLLKRAYFGTYTISHLDRATLGEDILLSYVSTTNQSVCATKEDFLASAGYYKDGKLQDYMFDSFIFLCQPNFLYGWNSDGSSYLKPYTKSDWQNYITSAEFAANKNINALDAAVGELKHQLNDPNYKAKVYMTLFYPVPEVTSFGIVNGKNLNLSVLEDRYAAMEWMVDESIEQFNSHNYQNVELAGFYWFCEEMYEPYADGAKIAKHTTDYVRSKGLKTVWCPYFGATRYANWKPLGFDIAAMQANYFPSHHSDWPNAGGSERLDQIANAVRLYKIGVGMELSDIQTESIKIFKEYMSAAITKDFYVTNHIYYMDIGPSLVSTIAKSTDAYTRSTYDELYKFLNRTLTADEII